MFELDGLKALITGATGGIGEVIARVFHQQGAFVGLHGTRLEKLESLSEELGERVAVFPADLSDRNAIKNLGEEAEKTMQGVDILVNNAGITRDSLFVRMGDSDWDKVLSVNLTAVFNLTRSFAHSMMSRRFGRIINLTSVVGTTGNAGQVNYCAAKSGLVGFSKALAQELATRNITVNCIAPGFIETAMTEKLGDRIKESITGKIPMKRMGLCSDVAAAAVYLASREASYVTGQTFHINGGMAMI